MGAVWLARRWPRTELRAVRRPSRCPPKVNDIRLGHDRVVEHDPMGRDRLAIPIHCHRGAETLLLRVQVWPLLPLVPKSWDAQPLNELGNMS